MPSIPAPTRAIGDGEIELRLAAERDIPEILIAHQDDPDLHARLGAERPPSGAQLGSAHERYEEERIAGDGLSLTILEAGSDDCRGRIDVHHVDWENGRADLGIWVVPQLRGRGVARRALRLAAEWLYENTRLERLALSTETDNESMVRAARAAGFVEEGVLHQYTRERGHRVDLAVMSLLRSDLEP